MSLLVICFIYNNLSSLYAEGTWIIFYELCSQDYLKPHVFYCGSHFDKSECEAVLDLQLTLINSQSKLLFPVVTILDAELQQNRDFSSP
jgi:hypothetical protein